MLDGRSAGGGRRPLWIPRCAGLDVGVHGRHARDPRVVQVVVVVVGGGQAWPRRVPRCDAVGVHEEHVDVVPVERVMYVGGGLMGAPSFPRCNEVTGDVKRVVELERGVDVVPLGAVGVAVVGWLCEPVCFPRCGVARLPVELVRAVPEVEVHELRGALCGAC